jgi:predicted transcriptional regulator
MAIANFAVTVKLSQEERELLEAFADEHELDDLGDAFRALLHEYISMSDALWDEKFARSGDLLDRLAAQVKRDVAEGRVEDFDPDNDSDVPEI